MVETRPNYAGVVKKVQELLDTNYLKEPPVNARELALNNGLSVVFVDFEQLQSFENVSGFIDSISSTMYVNANENSKRQNFTIAHELGHYILGHTTSSEYQMLYRDSYSQANKSPIEKEADCFAANLLVPEDFLKKIVRTYPYITDAQLSNLFAVSEVVIRNRRNRIGV